MAVVNISNSANCFAEHRDEAIRLLVLELQTETDAMVLKTSIEALPQLGMPALSVLIQQDKQVYAQLVQTTGRLLGIEALVQRINVLGQPTADELMAVYLFKQLPMEIAQTSLPWQDGATSDIDFFQMPDELAIQSDFRIAFAKSIKSAEATEQDETNARKEFQSGIRDLWVTTQAITAILKSLRGKFDGLSLRKTVLLHPDLTGVDLRGIDARSAIWMAPVLKGADLSFANLSHAEMKYADLRSAKLTGADIGGTDFGRPNRNIEKRTLTELRLIQMDVALNGTNLWEMANCYLRDHNFDSTKLQEFKDQRREALAKPEARGYLAKIPATSRDN